MWVLKDKNIPIIHSCYTCKHLRQTVGHLWQATFVCLAGTRKPWKCGQGWRNPTSENNCKKWECDTRNGDIVWIDNPTNE